VGVVWRLLSKRRRPKPIRALARGLDNRMRVAAPLRRTLNAVFPDRWSFFLGEIALYTFVVLVLTGTYLSFFYDPSSARVSYHGQYALLRGVGMSRAFESTVDISFDVRGGLLIRQIHHWASLLFVAAILLHLFRTFFSGAYRKPRQLNWLIGLALLMISIGEAFTGYVLPDDVLSGASLRIAESVLLSIPVIGSWLVFTLCDGPFPGPLMLDRLYIAHVLLIPGLLIAVLAAHLAIMVRQKHTAPPASAPSLASRAAARDALPGRRVLPMRLALSGGLFAIVAAVLALLGGLAQINPVWMYGPWEPAFVQAQSQADWYTGWLEGALRLFPPWEIRAFGHTVPAVFFPGVVLPMAMLLLTAAYPYLEARVTRDRRSYHRAERARQAPVRSAIGAAGITFYVVLLVASWQDEITLRFRLAIEVVVWTFRTCLFLGPAVAFVITYQTCVRLQARDRARALAPPTIPSGAFVRLPSGDYAELVRDAEPSDSASRDGVLENVR
jgi:ubiquinol-cytochrome c reductase cytochrome b subunit